MIKLEEENNSLEIKYDELITKLLVDPNDENLIKEFKDTCLLINKDKELVYENNYNNYIYLTLTLEDEQKRLNDLITYINKRNKEQETLSKEYNRLTKDHLDLVPSLGINDLDLFKKRLKSINIYLDTFEEYKVLDKRLDKLNEDLIEDEEVNIEEIKEVNKKIKKLYDKVKKAEIVAILYEFCLIDTYDIDEINVDNIFAKRKEIIITKEKEVIREIEITKEVPYHEELDTTTTIPVVNSIGTVKPTNKIQEIEELKKEVPDINLPDMGLTNNDINVVLDNEKYIENPDNTTK